MTGGREALPVTWRSSALRAAVRFQLNSGAPNLPRNEFHKVFPRARKLVAAFSPFIGVHAYSRARKQFGWSNRARPVAIVKVAIDGKAVRRDVIKSCSAEAKKNYWFCRPPIQ